MKPRFSVSLLIFALLLAGCYRQAEEPFQQIDSAEVVEATVALVQADEESGAPSSADDGGAGQAETPGQYITPETAPGQVEQPTVELSELAEATAPAPTLTPLQRPTATRTFEEQLDPDDECVYAVQAGNVLFRLALAWGTTYQTIMEVNQLESENLSIGQLLLMPDCESSAGEAALTPVNAELTGDDEAAPEPEEPSEPTMTPRPQIHVVSAGETIASISLRYRVDVNELIALNEMSDQNHLSVGQELKLPSG